MEAETEDERGIVGGLGGDSTGSGPGPWLEARLGGVSAILSCFSPVVILFSQGGQWPVMMR